MIEDFYDGLTKNKLSSLKTESEICMSIFIDIQTRRLICLMHHCLIHIYITDVFEAVTFKLSI